MVTEKYMKVSRTYQSDKCVPFIRMRGKWLEQAGFEIDSKIKVMVDYGKLTIMQENNYSSNESAANSKKSSRTLKENRNSLPGSKAKQSVLGNDYNGYRVRLRIERKNCNAPVRLNNPDQAYCFMKSLQNESRELMLSVMLNTKNQVVGVFEAGIGTINSAQVDPFEIAKAAFMANSKMLILAHNHPSGDPEPSQDDIELTKNLVTALGPLNISVLDHIIFGYERYASLMSLGYIKNDAQ